MKNITSGNNIYECTGCGMCAAVCPTNAITMSLSNLGFYEPLVNNEKCVECGKCMIMCYKYDTQYVKKPFQEDNQILVYSAQNHDNEELKTSSSGAVSIELMRYCIGQGYKVVGVAYDYDNERAVTKIANSNDELEQFKGSKYFQSYTEDAFREIVNDKSDQKYAIFGTPCQIYAFSKYAEFTKKQNKFILVDIFCHGCPSFTLWKKYLEYTKKKYGVNRFDKIVFRSKSNFWHEFCFDFVKEEKKVTSSKYNDPFYEVFFSNSVLNKACYDCVARGTVEKADIRLGDFWGARYDLDKKGVSAVAICSKKGEKLWKVIKSKFDYEPVGFEEVVSEQSYGTTYMVSNYQRKRALDILNSNDSFKRIVRRHRKLLSNKVKLKNSVKKIVKLLPNTLYIKIKCAFHKMK